jgi:nitrogen regulatory protein P-II 1
MADSPAQGATNQTDPNAEEHVLLIVIASDPTSMDDLLTGLLDIGVTGATLVESKGMAAALREEMPIFAGLVALLPSSTGSRMLFSITTLEQAREVLHFIETELRADTRPIAVITPVLGTVGLTR